MNKEMTFDDYQEKARSTAVYDQDKLNLIYPTLGLAGEVGEFANKVKKIYRDSGGEISDEMRLALKKELGDVQWYVAICASDLGLKLSEIAEDNIIALSLRKEKGVLQGSGDNR